MINLLEEAAKTASRCSMFGMCRVDFLGLGICSSGQKHAYVSYYPQGRMEIVIALNCGLVSITERLVDIARSCRQCGLCDKQCHFLTELRPSGVAAALSQFVENHLATGEEIKKPEEDQVLQELKGIVGIEWATNDEVILVTYSRARSPFVDRRIPRYVVLPQSTEEVAEVVKVAARLGLPFVPRGAGTNFSGALTDGLVIDLTRMNSVRVCPEKFSAYIGAGVTGFHLQAEASRYHLRANVAESSACVSANIVSTNLHSLFSHAYGVGAEHYIDAEIVTPEGIIRRLKDHNAPDVYAFQGSKSACSSQPHGICTSMILKLYPRVPDEQGFLMPFSDFDKALEMTREIGRRRIGFAAGLMGAEYVSVFPSSTFEVSRKFKSVLKERLGIEYMVMVLGDRYTLGVLRDMTDVVLDQKMIHTLLMGIPSLCHSRGVDLISELSDEKPLYKAIFKDEMRPLTEMALFSSPDSIAETVEADMKDFFKTLYQHAHMMDIVHLNMFRILSPRMGRGHSFAPKILYCPLDDLGLIGEICRGLRMIGDKHNLYNDFGYLVPLHNGKRAVMEYDYYFDSTNEEEKERVRNALAEAADTINTFSPEKAGLIGGEKLILQGLSRPETYLYV